MAAKSNYAIFMEEETHKNLLRIKEETGISLRAQIIKALKNWCEEHKNEN